MQNLWNVYLSMDRFGNVAKNRSQKIHLLYFIKYKNTIELLFYSFHKALICYFPPLNCSTILHKVQDLSGEVKRMRTNSKISNKQNAWFLQILNSWWCYLARWPSAHSRQSGVAWPDLLSAARLAGGWGEPRERGRRGKETGRKGRGQIKYQTLAQETHTKLN